MNEATLDNQITESDSEEYLAEVRYGLGNVIYGDQRLRPDRSDELETESFRYDGIGVG